MDGHATRTASVFSRPSPVDRALIVVALVAVSTSGPIVAATSIAGLAVAFWRSAMASAVLVPAALVRRRGLVGDVLRGRQRAATVAGVLLAVHFGTWVPSLRLTSVATATALVATQPVWATVFARWRGARISPGAWAGVCLAVVGAGLVAGADVAVSSSALAGDVLALVGGVMAAAYVEAGGRARRTLTTTAYTAICYSVCAIALAVVCVIGGVSLWGYSSHDWWLLLALTAGPQLLGHSVMNRVVLTTSPAVVSLAIIFEVPGAALLAWLWLGQRPAATAIPGIACLLLGVALVVASTAGEATTDLL